MEKPLRTSWMDGCIEKATATAWLFLRGNELTRGGQFQWRTAVCLSARSRLMSSAIFSSFVKVLQLVLFP